jgi:hypothetical protein
VTISTTKILKIMTMVGLTTAVVALFLMVIYGIGHAAYCAPDDNECNSAIKPYEIFGWLVYVGGIAFVAGGIGLVIKEIMTIKNKNKMKKKS